MQIIKETPFEFAYLVWQVRPPARSMIAVVKATFDLKPDADAVIAGEQAACEGDVHFDDDPQASVKYDSDLAVLKPRGECMLVGTCYPPGGVAVETSAVAFRVGDVKKAMAVIGDRHWGAGLVRGNLSRPVPFTSLPLRWERSFGGPGFDGNPLGRGIGDVEGPQGVVKPLPNVENPLALITAPTQRPEPVGSFPIPRTWAARIGKAGTYDQRWVKTRWPWFPEDFDYAYFNAAPLDQQIRGYWRGDEEIGLQNLHPEHAMLRTRLPGLRARCFVVQATNGAKQFREVPLNLDTIHVDADALKAFCVFRGIVEIASDKADDVEQVYLVQEPIYQQQTADAYRAALERKLAEIAAEEGAFEAEEIPPPEPPPAPPAPSPGGPDPDIAALLANLSAMGVDVSEPPAPPPSAEAPKVKDVKAAFVAAGLEVPKEFDDLEAEENAAAVPAEPGPSPRSLRDEVAAKYARGEPMAGEDLTGADLSSLDLRGADFSGAILAGAKFRGAALDGAKFESATLVGADFTAAYARQCVFKAADLTNAVCEHAFFDGSDFEGASAERARFGLASFRGANLAKVEWVVSDFTRADFREAKMNEGDFARSRLDDANFQKASLVDATLDGVSAERANLEECDLTKLRASEGAKFPDATFRHAKANGARFGDARLERANFSFAELERADFTNAVLVQALLNGCNLKKANFTNAKLVGAAMLKSDAFEALFESADLSHADARGTNFFAAEFWKAKTELTRFELANLKRTKLAPQAPQ